MLTVVDRGPLCRAPQRREGDMGTVTGSVHGAGCEWLQYDYDSGLIPRDRPVSFTMWRYRALLPVADEPVRYPVPIGGTPLLSAPALRRRSGTPRLWIKDETRGPTASNKDRATALVIEDGLRRGIDTITTASTGNAAVATAFGAAAAGLRAAIFVSTDCQPEKLALMTQAGARVFRVPRATRPPSTFRTTPHARSGGSTGTPGPTRSPWKPRRQWRSRYGSSSAAGHRTS